jgi:hypothetical protein
MIMYVTKKILVIPYNLCTTEKISVATSTQLRKYQLQPVRNQKKYKLQCMCNCENISCNLSATDKK